MRPTSMALFALCLSAGLSSQTIQAAETTAFTDVQVISMIDDRVVPGQTVLITDGKIARIGQQGQIPIPPDAFVITGAGRFLMPGLADMHTHINDPQFEYSFCNLFLANGVTTVRDLTQGYLMVGPPTILRLRREIEAGRRLGPSILTAFTIWGGEHRLADLVASQRPLGYDCLKINSYFSPAGFDTTMRKARELNWYTLGHIPNLVRLDGVIAGGMDELSHIEELIIFEIIGMDWSKITDQKTFDEELLETLHAETRPYFDASAQEIRAAYADKVAQAARKVKAANLTLTTTVYCHEDTRDKMIAPAALRAAPQARYTAPEFWKNLAAGRDKHQQMVAAGEERAWNAVYELEKLLCEELHKQGVNLVLGTDVGPTYLSLTPGFAVHEELRMLTECGFTPYEAIATATRNAGDVEQRMIGRNDFGTIEIGKRADLILLENNPLEDVANIRHPLGVMAAGRWLPRDSLQALLEIRQTPIADSLKAAYGRGGCEAALARYRWFTTHNFHNQYVYSENDLNQAGYDLLSAGRVEDALHVLGMNAEEYPESWNVFDSFGEACRKAGQANAAIRAYERACALDPSQANPRLMLEELRKSSLLR